MNKALFSILLILVAIEFVLFTACAPTVVRVVRPTAEDPPTRTIRIRIDSLPSGAALYVVNGDGSLGSRLGSTPYVLIMEIRAATVFYSDNHQERVDTPEHWGDARWIHEYRDGSLALALVINDRVVKKFSVSFNRDREIIIPIGGDPPEDPARGGGRGGIGGGNSQDSGARQRRIAQAQRERDAAYNNYLQAQQQVNRAEATVNLARYNVSISDRAMLDFNRAQLGIAQGLLANARQELENAKMRFEITQQALNALMSTDIHIDNE